MAMGHSSFLAPLIALFGVSHGRAFDVVDFMQREIGNRIVHKDKVEEVPCIGQWCATWVTPLRERNSMLELENLNLSEMILRLTAENAKLKQDAESFQVSHHHFKKMLELRTTSNGIDNANALENDMGIYNKSADVPVMPGDTEGKPRKPGGYKPGKPPPGKEPWNGFCTCHKWCFKSDQWWHKCLKREQPAQEQHGQEWTTAVEDDDGESMGKEEDLRMESLNEQDMKTFVQQVVSQQTRYANERALRAQSNSRMAKVLEQLQELVDNYQIQKRQCVQKTKELEDKIQNLTAQLDASQAQMGSQVPKLNQDVEECEDKAKKDKLHMEEVCNDEKQKLRQSIEDENGKSVDGFKQDLATCVASKQQMEEGFSSVKELMQEGFAAEKSKMELKCNLEKDKLSQDIGSAGNAMHQVKTKCEQEKLEVQKQIADSITKQCNDKLAEKVKEKDDALNTFEEMKKSSQQVMQHYTDLWEEYQNCSSHVRQCDEQKKTDEKEKLEAQRRIQEMESYRKGQQNQNYLCESRKNELEDAIARVENEHVQMEKNYTTFMENITECRDKLQETTKKVDEEYQQIQQVTERFHTAEEAKRKADKDHVGVLHDADDSYRQEKDKMQAEISRVSAQRDKLAEVNMLLTKEKLEAERQLEESLGGFGEIFDEAEMKTETVAKNLQEPHEAHEGLHSLISRFTTETMEMKRKQRELEAIIAQLRRQVGGTIFR